MADDYGINEEYFYEDEDPAYDYDPALANTFLLQDAGHGSSPPIDSHFVQGYGGSGIDPQWPPQAFNNEPTAFLQLQSPPQTPHTVAEPMTYEFSQPVDGPSHTNSQPPAIRPRRLQMANAADPNDFPLRPVPPRRPTGRRPFTPERRQEVALNRQFGNCIYHVAKKRHCDREPPSPATCGKCRKTGRPCYSRNRIVPRLLDPLRLDRDERLNPFLRHAASPNFPLPPHFTLKTWGSGRNLQTVGVDMRTPSHGQVEGDVPDLGQLEPGVIYQCAHALLDHPNAEWRNGWQGAAAELLNIVEECLSWHVLLRTLPTATYHSPDHQDGRNAMKSFIYLLVKTAVHGLRGAMIRAIQLLISFLDRCTALGRLKVDNDPGHNGLVLGVAALCRIAEDIKTGQEQSNPSVNLLGAAVFSTISQGADFSIEIEKLGYSFWCIKDGNSNREIFRELVDRALPAELNGKLKIKLDPARSQSSFDLDGPPSGSGRHGSGRGNTLESLFRHYRLGGLDALAVPGASTSNNLFDAPTVPR